MKTATNIPGVNSAEVLPLLAGDGGLMAFFMPADCLRSLENWPPFHRAFRQYVGNPEAIYSLYGNVRRQPDGTEAFDFQTFYTGFFLFATQLFLPNIAILTSPHKDTFLFSNVLHHLRSTCLPFLHPKG